MLGRELLPEGSVAAMAVPHKLISNSAIDEMATARLEKKRDENLIAMPSEVGRGRHFWPAQFGLGWQGEHVVLSGSIDIAFCQKEEKHHWKYPMYLANFRLCPF